MLSLPTEFGILIQLISTTQVSIGSLTVVVVAVLFCADCQEEEGCVSLRDIISVKNLEGDL